VRLIFCLSPGDDGEVGRSHASPHEEDHVLVPGLSVVHHLLFEELQVVLVVAVDLEEPDGYLAVPPPLMHSAPAALCQQTETLSSVEPRRNTTRVLLTSKSSPFR